jgi:nucleoside-diphosphate-sugar epimerase
LHLSKLPSLENQLNFIFVQKEALLFEQIRWIQADITEVPSLEIAFQNIDMVYHCAALISFDPRRRSIAKKQILKAPRIL